MRYPKYFKTMLLSVSLLTLLSGCGKTAVVHRDQTTFVVLEKAKLKVAGGDENGKPVVMELEVVPGDLVRAGPKLEDVKKAIGVK